MPYVNCLCRVSNVFQMSSKGRVNALVQNDTSDTPLWKRHELGDGESRFPREKTRPARQAGPRPAFIGNGRELLTVADMLVTEFLSTPFAICSSMASDICIQPLARLLI
jgi:hypothetical protein